MNEIQESRGTSESRVKWHKAKEKEKVCTWTKKFSYITNENPNLKNGLK